MSKATAAAPLVVTGLSMSAQAQQNTLTLACKGTTTVTSMEDAKPEPVSMGPDPPRGQATWRTPASRAVRQRAAAVP